MEGEESFPIGPPYSNKTTGVSATFIESFFELFAWADVNAEDPNFHNKFFEYSRHKLSPYESIAGKLQPGSNSKRLKFPWFFEDSAPLKAYADWRIQLAYLQERGDRSAIINALEKKLPSWALIDSRAKLALLEAENRYIDGANVFDHAATAHGYCKALEIHIKAVVFDKFKNQTSSDEKFDDHIGAALQDKKVNQFRALLSFCKNGHIELGGMLKAVEMAAGKTSNRLVLFSSLRKFLEKICPSILEHETIELLHKVVSLRNPAAHDSSTSPEELSDARNLVFLLFNRLV